MKKAKKVVVKAFWDWWEADVFKRKGSVRFAMMERESRIAYVETMIDPPWYFDI